MARIKINDLPKDMKISKEEMKMVLGGAVDTFLKIDGVFRESISIGGGGGVPTESISFSHGVSQGVSQTAVGDR